jgi:hypothetical protein
VYPPGTGSSPTLPHRHRSLHDGRCAAQHERVELCRLYMYLTPAEVSRSSASVVVAQTPGVQRRRVHLLEHRNRSHCALLAIEGAACR